MGLVRDRIEAEGLAQLSYLVGDDAAGLVAVIDPRRDVDVYLDDARRRGVGIAHVVETRNVVFLDTRGRWQVIPFIDLCDHDQRTIDMPDSDLEVLEEAGVVAVDGNGRALILEIEGADSGMDRIAGYQVVDVDRILGC